ncbi:MAG: energy transducer TonB [Muribaculaceae bacterium]|nr:energy transducer TonB [Muribaculaceae bacterium]
MALSIFIAQICDLYLLRTLFRIMKKIENIAKLFLITCVFVATAFSSSAQVKRVNACTKHIPPANEKFSQVYQFESVDIPPQFPGGERGLINFINKIKEYPYSAYERKVQGRVVCCFTINSDGSISDIRVIKGVDSCLNREAVRVIKAMPQWKAGKVNDEAVPVRYFLPIVFRL